MALKNILNSLSGKSSASEQDKKNMIADALINSEQFPIIRTEEIDLGKYRKVPLLEIATLGAAFASLPEAARTITQTVSTHIKTGETLFVGYNQKGVDGFLRANQHGTVGNIMRVNEQGKQVIAGRMRFKPIGNELPVTQTTTAIMPLDPMTMAIAAALITINQKLDTLQKKAEEILQFLKLEKQSRQRGNLNMLTEIMDEYKQDCRNEKMCNLRVVAVQDIKREAHQDIMFYQEQIARQLHEQKVLHSTQKSQEMLAHISEEFYEYQLACYLYAFSTFIELMLLKDFEKAASVAQKMEGYSQKYAELHETCHTQILNYQRTAVERQLLSGIGNVAKAAGQKLASVPFLNKGPVDEALIHAGEAISQFNDESISKRLEAFSDLKDSRMTSFIENTKQLDLMYNHPRALMTDGENLYILNAA